MEEQSQTFHIAPERLFWETTPGNNGNQTRMRRALFPPSANGPDEARSVRQCKCTMTCGPEEVTTEASARPNQKCLGVANCAVLFRASCGGRAKCVEQHTHFESSSHIISSTTRPSCFQNLLLRCHFLSIVVVCRQAYLCRVTPVVVLHPFHRY